MIISHSGSRQLNNPMEMRILYQVRLPYSMVGCWNSQPTWWL